MKKFVKFIFKLLLILIIAFVGIFFGKGYWGYLELTQSQSVDDVVNEVTSRSTFVGYDDLSPELVRATVAIEDRRFYDHGGVDYIGLMRALVSQLDDNLLKSGGSTITQQLAKNLYGMFDGTWDRKSTELFVARYLEKHYSKNEIIAVGIVDFTPVLEASFISIPNFQVPKFSIDAILMMLPVLLVIASEHIGHQIVTGEVVGRNLIEDPGLHRSLFADNFSTMISGLIGSVPTTTYGENIGVMAITGVYSVQVIAGAAILSIICSFIGPLSALIQTIPNPVIGGISFLLYGMIGTSGLRILVDQKVDYGKSVNMILTSVVFVVGLSGVTIHLGNISLSGMVLACITGMIMSLLFYIFEKFHLLNEEA